MHIGKRTDGVKAEQQARRELARLNLPPVENALTALAQITAEAIGWKDRMAGVVNDLTSLRYESEGEGGGEQLRAEVALWERALDRCEKFLTSMARLSIDERLAAIDEQQAAFVLSVLEAALDSIGIQPEQKRRALTVAAERFAA